LSWVGGRESGKRGSERVKALQTAEARKSRAKGTLVVGRDREGGRKVDLWPLSTSKDVKKRMTRR